MTGRADPAHSARPDVVTVWWCETCCSQGVIALPADTGVYEGFQRITDAHREAEPDCSTGNERVRVRVSEDSE
jgi:hypothetical protein